MTWLDGSGGGNAQHGAAAYSTSAVARFPDTWMEIIACRWWFEIQLLAACSSEVSGSRMKIMVQLVVRSQRYWPSKDHLEVEENTQNSKCLVKKTANSSKIKNASLIVTPKNPK